MLHIPTTSAYVNIQTVPAANRKRNSKRLHRHVIIICNTGLPFSFSPQPPPGPQASSQIKVIHSFIIVFYQVIFPFLCILSCSSSCHPETWFSAVLSDVACMALSSETSDPMLKTFYSFVPTHVRKIRLVWLPDHCGLTLNETADMLARMASALPIVEVLPCLFACC